MKSEEGFPELRIDKWLWAVRVFKTRSIATEACRLGRVLIGGKAVKPARTVRLGEVIVARTGELTRTVKVVGFPGGRAGPKIVARYMEDQTPPEEYDKRREAKLQPLFARARGEGRPTKKDRRSLAKLRDDSPSDT